MLRLILSLIIILGGGYMGIAYSARYKGRVIQLEELKIILKRLEFNIAFMNLPLSEALRRTAGNRGGVMSRILYCVSDELKNRKFKPMEELWSGALTENSAELSLNDEDKEIIIEFAKELGKGDTENEKNNIQMTLARLEQKYNEALSTAQESEKLHRCIGLVTGAFIAIILI